MNISTAVNMCSRRKYPPNKSTLTIQLAQALAECWVAWCIPSIYYYTYKEALRLSLVY